MIQCLAEKRADVNYRITVTRQIVRPPRKVDVVLSCCRKRIPALIVALVQKTIMLSRYPFQNYTPETLVRYWPRLDPVFLFAQMRIYVV